MERTHRGRFFESIGEAFWEYGPGAMVWGRARDPFSGWLTDNPILWVLLPDREADRGFSMTLLHMSYAEGNWARPGEVNGWNGDSVRPTLHPSIQAGSWQGWIKKGDLWV